MPGGGIDTDVLRSARIRAGLTQHQLAVLIGVAGGVRVSRWELGAQTPRPELALRLAKVLEVPVAELMPNGVGPDLRDLRVTAGLSVRTVAEMLAIPVSTYVHWEGGARKSIPDEGIVHRLADAFGVEPDEAREAFMRAVRHPRHRPRG